jgi:protoporphyrinogen oxidase
LPKNNLRFQTEVASLDVKRKTVTIDPGRKLLGYEHLISSLPLTDLILRSDLAEDPSIQEHAGLLRSSATHIIGLGIRGRPSPVIGSKCWMYFPEEDCPFYRATVFSNYSPNNVPNIREGWSLMCEVSESAVKPVDADSVVEETIRGALATRLVAERGDVIHTWRWRLPNGYPTPSLERDRALSFLNPALEERSIYSRGRFGAWKYEVSNQDHSFMQGVELVNRLLQGGEETTLLHPEIVNAARRNPPREDEAEP